MIRHFVGSTAALTVMGLTTAGFLALAAQGNHAYRLAHRHVEHRLAASNVVLRTQGSPECARPVKLQAVEARLPRSAPLLRETAYQKASRPVAWPEPHIVRVVTSRRPITP